MNTQTHVLLSSVLFTRSGVGMRARNIAAAGGGLLPDVPIFLMFLWSKLTGAPEMEVWEKWYFNPPWEGWFDMSHSFVLYWFLVMTGVAIVKWGGRFGDTGVILVIFALSALSHAIADFFLHVHDGHAHFWPLSDWRFSSPVSYWDPRYYGQYFSVAELMLGIGLCWMLFRRFRSKWIRAILLVTVMAYIAVPAYFIFVVEHHAG
jgi:hypothetical protein